MFTATWSCIMGLLAPVFFFSSLLGPSIIQSYRSAATGSLFIQHCICRRIIYKCFLAMLLLQYSLSFVSVVMLQNSSCNDYRQPRTSWTEIHKVLLEQCKGRHLRIDKDIQNVRWSGLRRRHQERQHPTPLSSGLAFAVGWI